MAALQHVGKASESNWLWPSIADAVDTFLRRASRSADSYERLWRLIHVWESIAVTLALVAVTRLRHYDDLSDTYKRASELLYGKKWNEVDESFKMMQGALDGSIDRWIDILWLIRGDYPQSQYLSALSEFLDREAIDLRPLAGRWASACDVPPDAQREGVKFRVREAMRHIAERDHPGNILLNLCTADVEEVENRHAFAFPTHVKLVGKIGQGMHIEHSEADTRGEIA